MSMPYSRRGTTRAGGEGGPVITAWSQTCDHGAARGITTAAADDKKNGLDLDGRLRSTV